MTSIAPCAAILTIAAPALSQGAAFQTPGMPRTPQPADPLADSGQSSRFDRTFNPAFGFVVDAVLDYEDLDAEPDGWNAEMRTLELAAQAWVDPKAWAYFILASEDEALAVEEAAVHYVGLGSQTTVRVGRFFVDFGKQMQVHVHELRTLERPLPLRTYLGEEVQGDGLEWDSWTAIGDSAALRWSLGAFASLLPEAEEEDAASAAAFSVEDRKPIGDFGFTGRATAFWDAGENGVLQLGTSARAIPSFDLEFEPSGDTVLDNSNTVLGLDLTYGWKSDTGVESWTLGGEYLVSLGDVGAEIVDVGGDGDPTNDTIGVVDQTRQGAYAFVDYGWSPYQSAGVQLAWAELPDDAGTRALEGEVYFTHLFSEFHRLRLVTSALDLEDGDDSLRFAIQYTATVGAHGHGINW